MRNNRDRAKGTRIERDCALKKMDNGIGGNKRDGTNVRNERDRSEGRNERDGAAGRNKIDTAERET